MDLFVNDSIISDDSDSTKFFNTSLEEFNKNAAVVVRRKEAVRLLSMLQWFMKCSAIEKNNYLLRLANEISLDDLMEVIKPIKLFFGKSFMLSEATYGTVCVDDKILCDDNTNLAPKTLKEVQEEDFKWFYNLDRVDQVEVILGLTKIVGVGNCRKLYQRLVTMYRSKHKEQSQIIATMAAADIADQNREDMDDSNCNDYAAAGDVHATVVTLRNNWAQLIAKYRFEVFGKSAATDKHHKRQSIVPQNNSKVPATASASTKSRKQISMDNQQLDQLQLLPLFISWKILAYLDNKTLQTVQQVNSYWSFAVNKVLSERAARVALDKTISKMAERLPTSAAVQGSVQQAASSGISSINTDVLGRCDRRLQELFERGTSIQALRRPAPSTDYGSTSLLQDVYKQAHFPYGSFIIPTEGVRVFPRCLQSDPPEVLLMGAECAAQWLEGAPGRLVPRRQVKDRQVAAIPLGRKVEAILTRQSLESITNLQDTTPTAETHNITSTNLLQQVDDIQQHHQQLNKPWYSTVTVTDQQGPQGNTVENRDVLSDLVSTTRMKVVPSSLNDGNRLSAESSSRPDAETVLRSIEMRISGYFTRSKIMTTDSHARSSKIFMPSANVQGNASAETSRDSSIATNQSYNNYI